MVGRRGDPPGVRLEVAGLDTLEQEWKDLAEKTDNIFASWEWASLWWRHFGADRRPLIVACRSPHDDRLVGILPLYLWSSRPLRILRFLGHGAGDQLGPIHAPATERSSPKASAGRSRRPDGESSWGSSFPPT
jgi:CelD/BcsL family acetyltransferase involved in cellulose biosynthesis